MGSSIRLLTSYMAAHLGCVMFFYLPPTRAYQTKPISLLIGCRSNQFLDTHPYCRLDVAPKMCKGIQNQNKSNCPQKSFLEFAWTREGGGPGGGSLEFGLHRDLASNHPKSSQQHFSLHSTPRISPQITKWIFWKMKLHIEDSAIFDGYSACLQIPA